MTQAKDLLSPFNPYMERCLDEYKYPNTTRAAIAGLRHYTVNGEERPLPSVTTILSKTKPKADQESIERWKARGGEKEANKIKNEAAARGTVMHGLIEDWLHSKWHLDMTDTGQEAHRMANVIIRQGLNGERYGIQKVYGIEATLYYPGLYAGSADLIATWGVGTVKESLHKLSIIDFKQTNKPKQRAWIGDYFLQSAAYAMAHDAVYGTNIEQGVILMCSRDGFFQHFVIEGEEFRQAKYNFLGRLSEFYSSMDNNSNALVSGAG